MKPNEAVRSRDDATTDVTYANMRVNNVGETDTSETYDTLDFRGSGRKSWATPKSAPTDYGAELRRLKLIITILAILFTITTITTLSVLISQVIGHFDRKSTRKAMNRNWSNQKANPAIKTKAGNK